MFDRNDSAGLVVDLSHVDESARLVELKLNEVASSVFAEDVRVRRNSRYAGGCDNSAEVDDRVDEAGVMTYSETRGPTIVTALDDDQDLIVACRPGHCRDETAVGRVKVETETIPYAQRVISASRNRIVAGHGSVAVHPEHLASHRRLVLGLLRLVELANNGVQLAVGPKLDVTTIMVDRVRRRTNNVKEIKSVDATISSSSVSDDVSVRV